MIIETITGFAIKEAIKNLWEDHGDEFLKWLKEKTQEKGFEYLKEQWDKWGKFKFSNAEQKYKEKIANQHGFTRIFGNKESTKLEGIFTDVYILNTTQAFYDYGIDDFDTKNLESNKEPIHGREKDRINGIELLSKNTSKHLFILGKPGSGKTTFLKYIALEASKGIIPKIPIFISLHEWSNKNQPKNELEIKLPLMAFIIEKFKVCSFPDPDIFIEYLLTKKEVILLFDGLDEVGAENNNYVRSEVWDFCQRYDKAQCLITCRVAATKTYDFGDFNYVEMADFNENQVTIFVKKWFTNELDQSDKFLDDLKKETYQKIKELTTNPLLLGMLCLSFKRLGKFGKTRIEIYDNAIDALLGDWDESKTIPVERKLISNEFDSETKKSLFSKIAYEMFYINKIGFNEKDLITSLNKHLKEINIKNDKKLDVKKFLQSIKIHHGIFVERAEKIYTFAHLTFQEYFTSYAIKENNSYQQALMKNIGDIRYREVFLLTTSLVDNVDYFLNY